MKILLVHPEDSPCSGPWAAEKWDLIVDLGKSSALTRDSWQERLNSPIMQLDALRRGLEDFDSIRTLLKTGRNRLVDEAGLDWWDLISVFIFTALEEALLLGRLAGELDPAAELCTTRPGWPASGVSLLLKRPLCTFPGAPRPSRLRHYRDLLRRFSFDQLAQIFLDKYDPRYRWRTQLARRQPGSQPPFVLLPSAYTNVSRMAAAYASLCPDQSFLLVATRRSGTHFDPAPNLVCANLSAYAGSPEPQAEYHEILGKWIKLKQILKGLPEMNLLIAAGCLENFPKHFRDGLAVRNAWRNVLSREQVVTVMCGDDSNPYTRLPVLLARQQGIPTLDFHHGALDGRYLMKELSSDLYLAKGEMERDYLLRICRLPAERVIVAGPPLPQAVPFHKRGNTDVGSPILFFSEPYETAGCRPEDVYRELLPPLARLAREFTRKLIVKLHPFESRPQRLALIKKVLPRADVDLVQVVEGPLTSQLISQAWFGVTVESTTVIDCSLLGVPCFVCGWLNSSPYEYTSQYARFGVGRILNSPRQLEDLPRLAAAPPAPLSQDCLLKPMDPEWLRQVIAAGTCAAAPKGNQVRTANRE